MLECRHQMRCNRSVEGGCVVADHIFAGTARYYGHYRPAYPDQVIRDLARYAPLRGGMMTDWGCGTGEVSIPLSGFFADITAVDVDPDMIAVAREKASQVNAANIAWVVGAAEDVELADASQNLIVAGSSFHWMDRELLARRAFSALRGDGAIAIVGGGSAVWDRTCAWHEVAVQTIQRWLGEQRRAGSGSFSVTRRHEDFLQAAGFSVHYADYRVEHTWSADTIVGYLYSTSYANPVVLGDRRQPFEADLRSALAALSPQDAFPEILDFHLLTGTKNHG